MTKRFRLGYYDDWWIVYDKEDDNDFGIDRQDVVNLLNELDEENKRLKGIETLTGERLEIWKQNWFLLRHNKELEKENKELREIINGKG